jgi:hypothetical protein
MILFYLKKFGSLQKNSVLRGWIQKFPYWVDNEIYAYNNKHLLRSNTKGYGGKTRRTDSQNSDITAPSDRELYHLQLSFQAANPETFGYSLVTLKLSLCLTKHHAMKLYWGSGCIAPLIL